MHKYQTLEQSRADGMLLAPLYMAINMASPIQYLPSYFIITNNQLLAGCLHTNHIAIHGSPFPHYPTPVNPH